MIHENIELKGSTETLDAVRDRMKKVGARGLDIDKAVEVGLIKRMSLLLCLSHATVIAAYHIYGFVDYVLSDLGYRKHEIAKAMNDFEKAFDRFYSFWSEYYVKDKASREINEDSEELYHRIMEWAQIPEQWNFGDEQRTEGAHDAAIKIPDEDGRVLYFKKTLLGRECLQNEESWAVTRFDAKTNKQTTVHTNMDKASALMAAKRLSVEDTESVYTASIVQDITEKRTEVTPFKAFRNNETIGKLV